MFQKVIVIGSPGAGKSTFARRLRDLTGLPLYHLDMLWHKADKTTVTEEEFDRRLSEILAQDQWIIDGNYQRTLPMRLEASSTVFLLDYPVEVCLEGAQSRIGYQREDLPWLEEEFDPEFRQWIIDFPQNNLPQLYQCLEPYLKSRNVVIFKSRQESENYWRVLEEH